ncbi:helix-turn-helix transcriptional regulator [Streptomonospora wellingtoniae]|uniref:YafY family protein n=1 Tax=Streptomonospora wellingtoniae TaxID=3075544 RepID=A0ABU2KY49_9ACTN|nr:YafY family protein [Streptomonospora sp. DSM 45055]MDT0304185.1 YafY family protein [Streptomonospora sp. DSM 45055]
MSDTSARLLRLLSLLQTPREWTGTEIAQRLGTTPRTVRRDIARLRGLDYPIRGARGPDGGYRLAAGAAMPPLLLDDEEAVAITVGLRTAASNPVAGIEDASARALAKLGQVLPARLRRRVGALGTATVAMPGAEAPDVDPDVLAVIASAVANSERLRFRYRSAGWGEGRGVPEPPRRLVEPLRLVAAQRRWYLPAWDDDRADWRIFRVDRIGSPRPTGVRFAPRDPPGRDAAAFVQRSLHSLAPTYEVAATLQMPAEEVVRRLPAAAEEVTPVDEGSCRLHGHADTLEWLAARLLMLGCALEVHGPPQLRAYLRAAGARAVAAAEPEPGAGRPSGADSR